MIYFDNAATTFPKPRQVTNAVNNALNHYGANPGRSGHNMSIAGAEEIYRCRSAAADMFHAPGPECVIFTLNCTHAMNMVLKGLLRPGDHVVTSCLEHNAVMRPLHALAANDITFTAAQIFPGDNDATVNAFRNALFRFFLGCPRHLHCGTCPDLHLYEKERHMGTSVWRRLGVIFLIVVVLSLGLVSVAAAAPEQAPDNTSSASCSPTYYRVRFGDTLTSIAWRYGVTVWQLQQWNGISNPNRIYAGQTLVIYRCWTPPPPPCGCWSCPCPPPPTPPPPPPPCGCRSCPCRRHLHRRHRHRRHHAGVEYALAPPPPPPPGGCWNGEYFNDPNLDDASNDPVRCGH